MTTHAIPLTLRDIEEIEGIAKLGMPIGGTLTGRLCADWRRLTAERDAAIEARRSIQAHCYGGQDLPDAISRAERAEAERDAARAALPDAQMLDSYAAGIEWEGFEAGGLRKAAAAIRALDTTPAPEVTS